MSDAFEVLIERKKFKQLSEIVADVAGLGQFFLKAADTERRMPNVRAFGSLKSCWPEFQADVNLAFGYNEVKVRLAAASPTEISHYELALDVALAMPVDDRRIVWAVAHSAAKRQRGPAWSKVGRVMGIHPSTVKRQFERAILTLWYNM